MKLKIISKNKDRLVLKIEGTTPIYLNTLRRMILSEVPVMAIEEIEIFKNNSILYDEMLAHRLGLIPLKTDLKSYFEKAKEEPESAKNTLELVLKATGPGKVYAKQIKSKDPSVKPAQPEMLIINLAKGQELELIAKARLGRGKKHAKFSPALTYYKELPYVIIKEDKQEVLKEIKNSKEDSVEIVKDKIKILNPDSQEIEFSNALMKKIGKKISFEPNREDFLLYIESWGQLKPETILKVAIQNLSEKIKEFAKLEKAIK